MNKRKNVIYYIPIRKGSERLKGKNVKNFVDKPLFVHTVLFAEALKKSHGGRIVIHTDYDKDFLRKLIEPFLKLEHHAEVVPRKPETCKPGSTTFSAFKDFHQNDLELDPIRTLYVMLQVTSPLRSFYNVNNAILASQEMDVGLRSTIQHKNGGIVNGHCFSKFECRIESGSFFVFNWGDVKDYKKISGNEALKPYNDRMQITDIDTIYDFEIAEEIYRRIHEGY